MMQNKNRNLIFFIVIALISGWIGVFVDSLLMEQPEGNTLGMGVWLIMPFVVSLVFHAMERDWNSMGFRLRLKGNLKWYMVSIAIYPLVTLITFVFAKIFNCVDISRMTFEAFIPFALYAVVGSFIKNIFEEFSWRGYLTPRLVAMKFNDWLIYIVSGLIWGLWHTAYYMVFLPMDYFKDQSRIEMVLVGCCLMIAWSIMFVEIYRITKSVWPCVLMHAIEDAVPTALVTTGGFISFTSLGDILFNPITGIFATILFVIIGLWIRKIRITKETSTS